MFQTDPDNSPTHSRGSFSGRQGFHQPVVGQRSFKEARWWPPRCRRAQAAFFLRSESPILIISSLIKGTSQR